jgi:hypothetical protein
MAKFQASKKAVRLDYDLTPPGDQPVPSLEGRTDLVGVVPEPPEDLVVAFQATSMELAGVILAAQAEYNSSEEKDRTVLRKATDEASAMMLDALADLCQGTPSRELLEAMPYRYRRDFTQWLMKELTGVDPFAALTGSPS